jgi:hypothetical protein
MNHRLGVELSLFRDTLDEQLEDLEVLELGGELDFYFDTSDVRAAALGMLAFYDQREWRVGEFETRRASVQMLMGSGWFGPFSLLPPHQAEFLALLDMGFEIPLRDRFDVLGAQFLNAVGVGNEGVVLDAMSESDMRRYIRAHAGEAERLFKAVHCINGSWYGRLSEWRSRNILHVRKYEINYPDLLASDLFRTIRDAFDYYRPGKSLNNFTDAMALASLRDLGQRWARVESNSAPRFFASSKLFWDVITHTGLRPEFEFKRPSGQRITVLRREHYFVVRAGFFAEVPGTVVRDHESIKGDLHRLRSELTPVLDAATTFPSEALEGVDRQVDAKYHTLVRDLQRLSFLENVWLPTLSMAELQRALAKLKEVAQQMDQPRFHTQVRHEYQEARALFSRQSRDYKLLVELWRKLEQFVTDLPPSIGIGSDSHSQIWAELGLLKFSFPIAMHHEITETVEGLLAEDEGVRQHALSRVVNHYFRGTYDEHDLEGRVVASAVLWTVGAWVPGVDRLIEHLLNQVERRRHPSLGVVYAAAALRLGDARTATEEIDRLEELWRSCSSEVDMGSLSVGLAYLYFHLWKTKYMGTQVEPADGEGLNTAAQYLVARAVEHASRARGVFHLASASAIDQNSGHDYGDLKALEACALNLKLFYSIEGHLKLSLAQLQDDARLLLNFELLPGCWSYRYDDTLARLYRRLAEKERRDQEREEWREMAWRRVLMARVKARGDKLVDNLWETLKLEIGTRPADGASMV